uniref:Uncharacterized protein n=1 Tax=Leersia perrieri TaxID=77586 RepID=A0A0D9X7M9_9ORYZ
MELDPELAGGERRLVWGRVQHIKCRGGTCEHRITTQFKGVGEVGVASATMGNSGDTTKPAATRGQLYLAKKAQPQALLQVEEGLEMVQINVSPRNLTGGRGTAATALDQSRRRMWPISFLAAPIEAWFEAFGRGRLGDGGGEVAHPDLIYIGRGIKSIWWRRTGDVATALRELRLNFAFPEIGCTKKGQILAVATAQ